MHEAGQPDLVGEYRTEVDFAPADADPDQLDVSALATTGPSRYADVTASTGEDCE